MRWIRAAAWLLGAIGLAHAQPVRAALDAYGDWSTDAPGVRRKIVVDTLPQPYASEIAGRPPWIVRQPGDATPHVPPGFVAAKFASGLNMPRTLRTAPNGDVFLAESGAGAIRVFSGENSHVFASGLDLPFGIAFWPPGPSPRFVYIAETNRVLRFPYPGGGAAETIVPSLPTGGHWTRDLAFSADGTRLFVSLGSASNDSPEGDSRAVVLSFAPDGQDRRVFASGLRNCSAEAVQPATGSLWCVVNERDGLGDNLPPDYATVVKEGEFYGWPWFYIGDHPDPRHSGASSRPVVVPDVLIQPHSAPLGIAFYDGPSFPAEYRGDAFVALHGSWNRTKRTGYKLIRLRFENGRPTGEYEDFMTGFVRSDTQVWGRPVGVTVAADGALLVSEDGNGTIWRIAYKGDRK